MRSVVSCLVASLLLLGACGDPQPTPSTPVPSRGTDLGSVVITISIPGKNVGSFPAARSWTVCGTATTDAPAWPDTEACRRLGEQPSLLQPIKIETRDLRTIDTHAVQVVSSAGTLQFPLQGSGTRANRWAQLKKALGQDTWNQVVSQLP
jgi:hypothetical protein